MEMQEEDRPDEKIWLDDEALAEHFERVRENWKNKYGNNDGQKWETIEDRPMNENELARKWRDG